MTETQELTGFEIVVPEPGEALKARIIHPENQRRSDEMLDYLPNKLPDHTVKQLLATEKRLVKALAAVGYDEREALIKAAAERWREIVERRAVIRDEAKEADADALQTLYQEYKALGDELEKLKTTANRLQMQRRPYVKQARQLAQVQQRLATHRAAVAREQAYAKARERLAQEARDFHDILIEALTGMGLCYRYHHRGKERVRKVKFDEIWSSLTDHWFKIRATRKGLFGWAWMLPRGLKPNQLIDPDILMGLTVAAERQVEGFHVEKAGVWYRVNRLGVTDGLVERVSYQQMIATYPREIHDRVPIPLGIKQGLMPYWAGLADYPHFLVAGASGSGKSNEVNNIICTAITYQSPEDLRIVFVDMKNGQEFGIYQDANLPHTMGDMVRNPIDFLSLLSQLETLREQRVITMQSVYARNLEDYNARVPKEMKMPRFLVIVDEFSRIYMSNPYMSNRENVRIADQIKMLVRQLLALGRSAGIQLLISTQTPYTEILPGIDKANISMKICFRFLDKTVSRAVLGIGAAADISEKFPGRGIIQTPGNMFMVQTPHITDEDREKAIEQAMLWERPEIIPLPELPPEVKQFSEGVTTDEIIQAALEEFGGRMSVYKLYQQVFKDRISRPRLTKLIREIASAKTIEFEGATYHVAKADGGGWALKVN